MKPHRPAPRTLASPPRAALRSPQAAVCEARFPSLAMVLAAGAALPACNAPVCGDTRADELTTHGAAGVAQARGGNVSQALHEIGVALGLAKHARTTSPHIGTTVPPPEMPTAGAVAPVNVTPPTQPPPQEPPMALGGAPMPTTPEPPTPPPPSQNPTRVRPPSTTSPTPVPMPRNPGAPRIAAPPPPTTNPEPQLEGDVVRVSPLPASTYSLGAGSSARRSRSRRGSR